MPTYRATEDVELVVPNKLAEDGNPAGDAVWRTILVPAYSLFTVSPESNYIDLLATDSPTLAKEI